MSVRRTDGFTTEISTLATVPYTHYLVRYVYYSWKRFSFISKIQIYGAGSATYHWKSKNPHALVHISSVTMESSTMQKLDSHQNQHQTQHNQLQSPQPKHVSRSLSTNPTNTKWLPHEERLRKAWRVIGTTVANCMSKAEKAADPSLGHGLRNSSGGKESKKKELDESVVLFLRTRREFHRLLSHAEAKLQGKAEEMESLETYVRTQPRIGTRKRKR